MPEARPPPAKRESYDVHAHKIVGKRNSSGRNCVRLRRSEIQKRVKNHKPFMYVMYVEGIDALVWNAHGYTRPEETTAEH